MNQRASSLLRRLKAMTPDERNRFAEAYSAAPAELMIEAVKRDKEAKLAKARDAVIRAARLFYDCHLSKDVDLKIYEESRELMFKAVVRLVKLEGKDTPEVLAKLRKARVEDEEARRNEDC